MTAYEAYNQALDAVTVLLTAAAGLANATPPASPRYAEYVHRVRGIADAWDAIYDLAQEEDVSS